jgi:hypothetical protein
VNFCIRGAAKRRGCLPPRFVEFLDQQVVPLLKAIAAFLHDDAKVDFIAPAHCTGEPAFGILKESFGDKYVYAGLGSTVIVGEKVTVNAKPASRLSTRWTLTIIEATAKPWLADLIAPCSAEGAVSPQRLNKESHNGTSCRPQR